MEDVTNLVSLLAEARSIIDRLSQALAGQPTAEAERWLPARYYEQHDISPDTLRRAGHDGRIRMRKGRNGNRNLYHDGDVRDTWPDRFVILREQA